ncbi:TetR/AcrR family transcriptional regulator [Actinoplanes sp. GCM10030250]|uniref:TetR/AcrR family transcriptional regulator n=1 Tax=Actinoplanes sp. GCM10030250 TaxID=3273376 RepID=UPI00361A1B91
MAKLREAQKEMTRRLLLEAGLSQFVEKGYAATTVDDIASAAGTTRVTFYAYFPSRGELMKALIGEQLNERLQRSRLAEQGSTALDLVAAVAEGSTESIGAWIRASAERWPDIRPIMRIGRDAAVVEPDLRDLVVRWLDEAVSDVEDGLNRADRFDPAVRRFRGVLAVAELDYVAHHWDTANWHIDHARMLDELASSWVRLLGPSDR